VAARDVSLPVPGQPLPSWEETMSTSRTRATWPGGVIAAAAIAVTLGGSVICGQTHQGARQAMGISVSAAIICPPPSGDGLMSKSGDPGC